MITGSSCLYKSLYQIKLKIKADIKNKSNISEDELLEIISKVLQQNKIYNTINKSRVDFNGRKLILNSYDNSIYKGLKPPLIGTVKIDNSFIIWRLENHGIIFRISLLLIFYFLAILNRHYEIWQHLLIVIIFVGGLGLIYYNGMIKKIKSLNEQIRQEINLV